MNEEVPKFPTKAAPPATTQNRLIDGARRASGLAVEGDLVGADLAGGKLLTPVSLPPILGRITGGGAGQPYEWEFVTHLGSDAWDGVAPGGGLAYEVNGYDAVPYGRVVELFPGAAGDWRFQFRRTGGSPDQGCPGGGSICVSLGGTCLDWKGVKIDVTGTSAGTFGVSDSATTAVNGYVCFDGLPVGLYSVECSKPGCECPSWHDVEVRCNQTTGLSGVVVCPHSIEFKFCVKGCGNLPLPGAIVTISGPGGSGGVGVTGDDGCASFAITKPGRHDWSVTHPSGRFADRSGVFPNLSNCSPTSPGGTILLPAPGYVCCVPGTPYPCKETIFITDSEGGTVSVNVNNFYCLGNACVERDMDEVALNDGSAASCACDAGGSEQIPPSIGRASTSLGWSLIVGSPAPPVFDLKQYVHMYFPLAAGGLLYREDCPETGLCSPADARRTWRMPRTCDASGNFNKLFYYRTDGASSYVVNSLYPLNVTFFFGGPGDGFGPVGYPGPGVTGAPYASSATIHE